MSDIHILEKDVENKRVSCIFHISIPDTNNAVGLNWRTAIQRSLNPVALMDYNDSLENTDIEDGIVLEIKQVVRFSSTDLTNLERLAEVEAEYTSKSASLLQELQAKLNFFGETI